MTSHTPFWKYRPGFLGIACLFSMTLCAQVERGLVADFSFNKASAMDRISGRQAKAVGVSYVNDRFGNPRSACYLHGNYESYINLGTDSALKPKSGTVSLWIKIDAVMEKGNGIPVNPIILAKNGFGDDFFEGYFLEYNYESKRIVATTSCDSARQVTLSSNDAFALQEWHHLAITYDRHFLSLYVDGVNEIQMAKNFESCFDHDDSVMIGNTANTKNKRFLNGSIDDIRIFNRVLSPQEVGELYREADPNEYRTVLRWISAAGLIVLGMALVFWLVVRRYKRKLEIEKYRNEVQAKMYALETRAFRSQMNPHFIFNALNTIQRFILDKDTDNAHAYLTKFAKLLRKLLEASASDTISLADEIEMLKSYLEIESLRFENSFGFEIDSDFEKGESIMIPIMFVQPFVENAIWHGLLHKSGERTLKIRFSNYDEKRLRCVVDDNGVGRHAAKPQGGRQSLATELIRQRLDVLSKMHDTQFTLHITDKKDAGGESLGTTVEILIPKFMQAC